MFDTKTFLSEELTACDEALTDCIAVFRRDLGNEPPAVLRDALFAVRAARIDVREAEAVIRAASRVV